MEPWRFVHINDMQPGSPKSFRFRPADLENQETAYRQIQAIGPELILVGGDLTRDGSLHDFELDEAKTNLDMIGIPYRAVPGNMDTGNKHASVQGANPRRDDVALNVTSQALRRFQARFGDLPWTFVHRNTRFTGIYAAVAGSGLPEEQAMWEFLEHLPCLPRATHHVLTMHYALFMDSIDEPPFDPTDPDQYLDWYACIDPPHRDRILQLLKASGVTIVLSGHLHCRVPTQNVDGIRFYKTPATCFGQYAGRFPNADLTPGFSLLQVTDDDIAYQVVAVDPISQRTDGYGPGGHPRPDERDYSLAWDRTRPEH